MSEVPERGKPLTMVMKSLCMRNFSGGTESPIRLRRRNGQGGAFQRARQIFADTAKAVQSFLIQ